MMGKAKGGVEKGKGRGGNGEGEKQVGRGERKGRYEGERTALRLER